MEKNLISPVKRIRTDVVKRIKCPVKRPEGYKEENDYYYVDYPLYTESKHGNVWDLVNGLYTEAAPQTASWVTDFLYDMKLDFGKIAFLTASCGTGKNEYVRFLVENRYYQRVLVLANRKANKLQIMDKLGVDGTEMFPKVVVKSYQSLELTSEYFSEELELFDLIVADEAHYFLNDSLFNPRVNVSLRRIMMAKRPAKLFMSATLTDIEALVIGKIKEHRGTDIIGKIATRYMLIRKKQHIKFVACVDYKEIVPKILGSSEKWLIFVDSIKKGTELKKSIGAEAVFICAENSEANGEAVAEIKGLIENEMQCHRVVISTSILDNGITIKDTALTNIVIDCNDRVEMVQMLGRKRCINEEDQFSLYLVYQDANSLEKVQQQNQFEIRNWIRMYRHLEKEGFPPVVYSMETEEGQRYRRMCYMDATKKSFEFNYLGLYKLLKNEKDLQELCSASDPFRVKCKWLFEDIGMPEIVSDSNSVVKAKIGRILAAIEQFAGKTYPVKDAEFKAFQKAFSESFWQEFCLDKEENHRSDRMLTPGKIKDICEKYEIPVVLEKKKIVVNKKRTTAYSICIKRAVDVVA